MTTALLLAAYVAPVFLAFTALAAICEYLEYRNERANPLEEVK